MSKKERRKLTADQKLQVLREAEQPGVTISEVCRRNGIAPSVFYRWRSVAQTGSASALKQDARRLILPPFRGHALKRGFVSRTSSG